MTVKKQKRVSMMTILKFVRTKDFTKDKLRCISPSINFSYSHGSTDEVFYIRYIVCISGTNKRKDFLS